MNEKRLNILIKNYLTTRKEGQEIKYDIRPVIEDDEPNYEKYIIKLNCYDVIYKNQIHYLEVKTTYGSTNEIYKYPNNPPFIKFLTKIFHVNINNNGLICLDILNDKTKWSVAYKFSQIILSIKLLLDEPNTNSPFNCDASNLWKYCVSENKQNNNLTNLTNLTNLDDSMNRFQTFIDKANEIYKTNSDIINKYEKLFINDDEEEFNNMFNKLCIKNTIQTNLSQTNLSQTNLNQTNLNQTNMDQTNLSQNTKINKFDKFKKT
jgi:hypothetical protein